VVKAFMARYPEVVFRMHQATPAQIAEMAIEGSVDFAIASEGLDQFGDFILLPCYRWNHAVIVPKGHLLTKANKMTLELLAQHPLATYVHGFTGRQKLDQAFIDRGLNPKIVFTATNADVIKTYVRMGLGVGIIARMALDSSKDNDFLVVDGENLFTPSVCNIAFRRGTFMRGYMYDFIEYFAPHLTRELVDQAMACHDKPALQQLFQSITLPTR
jgi:LysR family cys regulon transcriptional activator